MGGYFYNCSFPAHCLHRKEARKMKKGKILQPILFALALVMVFSIFGVAPAYAGCRHSYNSDSVYIRSNNRNDYFKVTKVCTKCHKRTSVTRSLAHSYTYGGKIEQYYGADKFHDYFYVYKKCIRYNMCHHKVFSDYSSPQAARVLMVAFWLSPYTAGALEESSLPEHRHFAPKTIRGTAVLADAFHVSFNMRKA